jgi:hypothetical protein
VDARKFTWEQMGMEPAMAGNWVFGVFKVSQRNGPMSDETLDAVYQSEQAAQNFIKEQYDPFIPNRYDYRVQPFQIQE